MSKKETKKEALKSQQVSRAKQVCHLSKEHKRYAALLYRGKMHRDILKDLGAPDKERTMMLHEVKRPGGGYTGI